MKKYATGKYSAEEIKILKDVTISPTKAAKLLGRALGSIHTKRSRMKSARLLVDTLDLKRVPPCEHDMNVKFLAGVGSVVNCKKCGFVPYELGRNGHWIQCHTCGMRSHSQMDVKYKFCGKCNVFHDTQNPRTFPGQTQ